MSAQPMTLTESPEGVDRQVEPPPSPTRAPATDSAASRRHAKGLSLNFPILLPTNTQLSQSPTAGTSFLHSPGDSARSSPRIRPAAFKSPETPHQTDEKARPRRSADFLTLLAAQERKVLELREELHKAEADLLGLKRHWASYEATKKRDEVKHVKKLQSLALDDVPPGEPAIPQDDVDEDRRRKRALVERSHSVDIGANTSNLSRKGSKRVFEGGRHTRTLSLLSPTSARPGYAATSNSISEMANLHDEEVNIDDDAAMTRPSLARMSTLDSLMSGDPLQLGFGKTYKDLASNRSPLPPMAAEVLVKQGKQVYDGVREGLWTFFEDIRQATVGEEGVNGTASQQRPPKPAQKRGSKKRSNGIGRAPGENRPLVSKEPSFWKEFGLETPKKPSSTPATRVDKSSGHVQQKSSTDSTNPPSLLPDVNDLDEVDDAWDAWDSPVSHRDAVNTEEAKKPGGALPWPEIHKLTPSKLTRTVSDLMREWDAGQGDSNDSTNMSRIHSEDQTSILSSPHI